MNIKTILVSTGLLIAAASAQASPTTIEAGECSIYQGDDVISTSVCSISTKKSRNIKNVVLTIGDVNYTVTSIYKNDSISNSRYSINAKSAQYYLRDAATKERASLSELELINGDALRCYQNETIDVCYS